MDRITKKYGTKSEMSHILSYDPAFEMSSSSSSFSSSFSSTVMTLAVSSLVQYKIGVNLIPTNEYLCRYRVLDSSTRFDDVVVDTIILSLWECSTIQPFLAHVLQNVTAWAGLGANVDMVEVL